ncbi:MAG: hypothetical protein NHG12_01080 [Candidatus Shikimatogenerans bostrichidophilus]|nr:MAG: hypothetical protein NHG12_01080 [Candidatus Shikimatogenerans bostrichidophilus]
MNIENIKIKKKSLILDISNIEKKNKCNIYKIINILSKRSNIIKNNLRIEFNKKKKFFLTNNNEFKEFFLNKEQIEISKIFEKLPKSTLISIFELLNNNIDYYNN